MAPEPRQPCASCPWRRANPPTGADIPGFSLKMMRDLRNTAPEPGEGDDFRPIMACHHSPPGDETACRGYVAQHGITNIYVRLLAASGKIDLRGVQEACAELELWPDFLTMLAAYEAAAVEEKP